MKNARKMTSVPGSGGTFWKRAILSSGKLAMLIFVFASLLAQGRCDTLELQPRTGKIERAVGGFVMVTCLIRGDVTMVKWSKDGDVLTTNRNVKISRNGRELKIKFPSLRFEDAGRYVCEGITRNQTFQQSIELQVWEQAYAVDTPTEQGFLEGTERAVVTCKFGGIPQPEIAWQEYDPETESFVEITNNKTGNRIYQDRETGYLTIESPGPQDSGMYHCFGVQGQYGYEKQADIAVSVEYPPREVVINGSNQVDEGSVQVMTCTSDAQPQADYLWYRAESEGSDQTVQIGEGPHLNLSSFKWNDSGFFECRARNKHGVANSTKQISFTVKPTIVFTNASTCVEGKTTNFVCSAQGFPLPQVSIIREGEEVTSALGGNSSVVTSYDDDTMTSSEVPTSSYVYEHVCSREMEGSFTCKASNQFADVVEEKMILVVYYGPRSGHQVVEACEGERVKLRCDVIANPPVTSYNWTDAQGNAIDEDLEEEGRVYSKMVTSSSYTSYTCVTSNNYGEGEMEFEITKPTTPQMVSNLQVMGIERRKAIVTYDYPDEGGAEEANFKYNVTLMMTSSGGSDVTEEEQRVVVKSYETERRKLELDGLRHSTKYQVAVRATKCKLVASDETVASFTTDKLVAPSLSDFKLNAKREEVKKCQNGFCLSWDFPTADEVDVVEITYVKTDESKPQTKITINRDSSDFQNKYYLISDLEAEKNYEFVIKARNSIGWGLEQKMRATAPPKRATTSEAPLLTSTPDKADMGDGEVSFVPYIILAAIVIFVLLDLICCLTKQCGFFHFIYSVVCGGAKQQEKDPEAAKVEGGGDNQQQQQQKATTVIETKTEKDDAKQQLVEEVTNQQQQQQNDEQQAEKQQEDSN